jgi:Zn-dependent peptidase ImmA (M78 family)/DNA-binding XRE family transcriptional regulator
MAIFMISQRIKQLRLARGMSQDALVAVMGGIVTKQAISKYETGKAVPGPAVVMRLAQALGVKSTALWGVPVCNVEFIAYRKSSGLGKRDQVTVENLVRRALEERVSLHERVYGRPGGCDFPLQQFKLRKIEDSEAAAEGMRDHWNLGRDPIGNLVGLLEDRQVHVIEIDAPEKFDGISAFAKDDEGCTLGAAVVSRRGVPRERQRLNLTHELGHTVLKIPNNIDEEKAAFRFAGAFLAPRDDFIEEVGAHRSNIEVDELLILKRKFGMSMQALLRRMCDLEVINDAYYKQWCITINKQGWRRDEPESQPAEEPQWLHRTVLRGVSEGALTAEEGKHMLGITKEEGDRLESIQRRAFMKLPMEERRRILAQQANELQEYYEQDVEWRQCQGGDVHEYDS